MADTLKQVQLDRSRMIENNQGATESSRAALSAILGRNVLKTKAEVAKLRRDEENEKRMISAQSGVRAAERILKRERLELQAERQEEAMNLAKRRLGLADRRMNVQEGSLALDTKRLDLEDRRVKVDEGYLEVDRDELEIKQYRLAIKKLQDQKNNVLEMMNAGIYDPSFAMVLEMPEDVVRQAAANKKAKLDALKTARAKVAQAEQEYLDALEDRDDAIAKEKAWYETNVDSAITEAEETGEVSGTAAEVKENILASANVDKVLIPWATPTNTLTTFSLSGATDVRMSGGKVTESTKETVEQIQKQAAEEKKQSEKQVKAASAYYDQVLTEKIYAKEKAEKELSALEASFKEEQEKTTAYQLRMKRFGAVDQMENATTAEEVTASYNEYLAFVAEESGRALDDAESARLTYNEKYENAENYTQEEMEYLEELRLRLEDLQTMLEYEIETGGLTEEGKAALLADIENIEIATTNIEAVISYGEVYEEIKSSLLYDKMEQQYNDKNFAELENYAEQLKRALQQEYSVTITEGTWNEIFLDAITPEGVSEANKRRSAMKNDSRYQEYTQLVWYLEQREEKEKEAEQDERASETFEGMSEETLTAKMLSLMDNLDESEKQSKEGYIAPPDEFWLWGKEKQCEWFNKTYGTDHTPENFSAASELGKMKAAEMVVSTDSSDTLYDASSYFHRNIVASNEALFTPETLEQYAAQAVENANMNGEKLFEFPDDENANEMVLADAEAMKKYAKGIDGLFEGNYSSVVLDFDGFLKGDYGNFTEQEVKTILALMAKYGTDEAFVHYAAVRDEALKRKAQEFTGFGRAVRGVTSGLTQFMTNGGEMLENAFTQQYSRIAGTLGTASHQINMENFSQKTGIGNDALELLYMGGYSIFDMVPAVTLGAVPYMGTHLSSAYTFAKVTATTYNDSILAGKRADEALTYAMLSATAEVGLEKILDTGGQTFAKGGLGKAWKESIENLASTKAMQVIIKTAGSMGSEGFEEFLQECLSPFLEKVAADLNGIDDATLKEIDWEEAAKSFAIGAITGGIFGGFEAVSSSKNAGMKESEARALLESGKVVNLINAAAELGNQRALAIKQAIQNGQTLYEGQEGYFAYASPADIINITQSVKRKSVKQSMAILQEKYNVRETNKKKQKTFDRLFKKILWGNTLTLQETADIINDREMSGILNEMLGMDVTMMTPDQVLAVAKLAAFAENGKISQARVDLFKDAFGELDTKALAEIVKYSDMAAKKVSGILYEDANAESQLTEAEQESAEVLKILSTEVGTVFYVTDQFDTGTYLAANMMAVRPGDLAGGVSQTVLKRVYYITKQLNPKAGKTIRDLVLEELYRTIGKEAVDAEIKQIRRQAAENGNDIGNVAAEQELCARHFPSIILKGTAVEKIAQMDVDATNALRKALRAVQEHLEDTVTPPELSQDMPEAYRYNYLKDTEITVEQSKELSGYQAILDELKLINSKAIGKAEKKLRTLAENIGILNTPLSTPCLDFEFRFSRTSLGESLHNQADFEENYSNYAKVLLNLNTVLKNAVLVEIHSDKYKGTIKRNEHLESAYVLLSSIRDENAVIPVKLEIKKLSTGESTLYVMVALNKIEADLLGKPHKNKIPGYSLMPTSIYSISKIIENVNREDKNFLKYIPDRFLSPDQRGAKTSASEIESDKISGLFEKQGGKREDLWGDTNALYERLTALVRGEEVNVADDTDVDHDPTYTDADQVRAENDTVKIEDVFQAHERLKEADRNYQRELRRNALSEFEHTLVDALIRGEVHPEQLDGMTANKQGVMAVYQMKAEKEKQLRIIREHKEQHRAKLFAEADTYLETANDWKDKKMGLSYEIETMERNVEDIVPDKALAAEINRRYFKPIHKSAAEANRLKNNYRQKVLALGLSRKVAEGNENSEASAVQILGEVTSALDQFEQRRAKDGKIDGRTESEWQGILDDLWANNPNLDRKKIYKAVDVFRDIYDDLFKQMNEARVRNGYEPVKYRKGYFLHFQPGETDSVLALFGKALGIGMEVDALPTTISGLTHTFKPGIQWFGSAMERKGYQTVYDAVEGFDKYIEGVADVICQTDNIQALRALATRIRYRTSDEGMREQMNAIFNDESLDDIDKNNRIKELNESGRFTLSKFVVHLDEYTNLLANKKARGDRDAEHRFNRSIYRVVSKLESRVAANMIVGNVGSWLTNGVPLTAGFAEFGTDRMLEAMRETVISYKKEDGFWQRSTFLINRRGSDPIVRKWMDKTSATLNSPMEYIDRFVTDSLVRARYELNLEKGMSEEAAIDEADDWTARVVADRSKGATPTIFSQKHPFLKLFTQFQLEVNNNLSYMFKDLPRAYGKRGAAAVTAILLRLFIAGFLYDEIYEYFKGSRPAFDPFGILNDLVGDMTGYQLPNLLELTIGAFEGDLPSFKTQKENTFDVIKNTGKNVLEQVPFVGGILGGGRIPISSALPDWEKLGKALFSDKWDLKKRAVTIGSELLNPAIYLATPFAGGQLKRSFQGVQAVVRNGSYSVNGDGEDVLQYPVYNDSFWDTAKNGVQAVLFGRTSLLTAQEWVDDGFDSLNAKETTCYKGLIEVGVSTKEAYSVVDDMRSLKDTEDQNAEVQKHNYLKESNISDVAKAIVYYNLLAQEDERELMDMFLESETDMGEAYKALSEIRAVGSGEGAQKKKQRILFDANLTDAEKVAIYQERITTEHGEEISDLTDAGLTFDQYLSYKMNTAAVDGKSANDYRKFKAIDETSADENVKIKAAKIVANDSNRIKLTIFNEYGIGLSDVVAVMDKVNYLDDQFDGGVTNAMVKTAIDDVDDMSDTQRAVLWQLFTGATSAKNNPYSSSIGTEVVAKNKALKEAEEE